MTDKLTEFMTILATDTDLQEAYKKDPDATMKKHDVEKKYRKMMINHEYSKIEKKLGANYKVSWNTIITAAKIKS